MPTMTPIPPRHRRAAILLLLLLHPLFLSSRNAVVHAILPTAAIDVHLPGTSDAEIVTLFASQAGFGGRPSASAAAAAGGGEGEEGLLVPAFPPDDDPYLCDEYDHPPSSPPSSPSSSSYSAGTALLVPRGRCSFERKALSAQRLGSSAIVIYGTLSSRYSLNVTNSTPTIDDSKTRDYAIDDVIWPLDKYDYDCDNGRAYLPEVAYDRLNFVRYPGGYDEANDVMLTGATRGNACVAYDDAAVGGGGGGGGKSFVSSCASRRCLVTGRNVTDREDDDVTYYEACCAWDTHVWLYPDASVSGVDDERVIIPAVYVTMEESSVLLDLVRGAEASGGDTAGEGGDPVVIAIYERPRPKYNASAVLIWALGVFVAWISSYMSSGDIRRVSGEILARREHDKRRRTGGGMAEEDGGGIGGRRRRRRQQERGASSRGGRSDSSVRASNRPPDGGGVDDDNDDDVGEERTIYRAANDDDDDDETFGPDALASAVAARHRANISPQREESLELTAGHAAGFLVMASCSLLILFFLKTYNVVKVMYAFGCSGAFGQTMVHPALSRLCRMFGYDRPTRNFLTETSVIREAARGGVRGSCVGCIFAFFGPISPLDVTAMTVSYGVGAAWLYIGFAVPHPGTVAFYWIVQNVFGLCMCMLFLETIKLNAIKVGAVLLIVAFFYDIFFVFVTPLLTKHGESIMVNVATSGGPPKADPAWCEKYPFDANCRGGDPLPMLFAVPRIGDYQGGSSMLGLGDIVLPGLLLSFASRFDESKRLMGMVSGGSGRSVSNNACPVVAGSVIPRGGNGMSSAGPFCFLCSCCLDNGYFGPVMVGYAIGLFMANAAVYIMEMGQPALLYLVPCCLGTMVFMGRRAGELSDLWDGPRVIRAADAFMYGEATPRVDSAAETEDREQELASGGDTNNEGAEMT